MRFRRRRGLHGMRAFSPVNVRIPARTTDVHAPQTFAARILQARLDVMRHPGDDELEQQLGIRKNTTTREGLQ